MRINDRELIFTSSLQSDREGRLNYKSPNSRREGYKERWFKLKGNLLFYFRLNEHGGVYEREPVGLFVIENCRIQLEPISDLAFAFSIVFYDEIDKKHMFYGTTLQHCEHWVKSLGEASYEHLRVKCHMLRMKILQKQSEQQEPKQFYRPISKESCIVATDIDSLLR